MKKFMLTLSICLSLLLCSCSSADGTAGTQVYDENTSSYINVKPYDEYEKVDVECDRIVYQTFEELLEGSDIVVIGEYCGTTSQVLKYHEENNERFLYDATTYDKLKIEKVLYGDAKVGDIVDIAQSYGYVPSEDGSYLFWTMSELTPMKKGDRWLFFLNYDEGNNAYFCTGDTDGRYPVPNGTAKLTDEQKRACVYEEWTLQTNIYEEVITRYKLV